MKFFSSFPDNYTDDVKFDTKSVEVGHHKLLYKNVPMLKCPFDYVIYQMIIFEIKPDLIIEIGTNRGGSAYYLADLLEMTGQGELHTIDIDDIVYPEVKAHKRIRFFFDGFEKYDIEQTKKFNTILVIEDGSHTYEDTKAALEKFKNVIKPGSYFIAEDGILDKLGWKKKYNGGPNTAIKEFISQNKNYIIDRKWCDLFGINATFNTNGYLKKISNDSE